MPRRYLLVAIMFSLTMLLYVDRICISAAKTAIADDLGFTDQQMSWVFSAFTLGYALFQVPSGALADYFGPRRVIALVVCFWSAFTALTAAARNLAAMLIVRFLFGVGEAGAFPGCARAIYSWLPVAERGVAQGINFSGSRLGAAFALPAVAWMTAALGWRTAFVLLGVVGLTWASFWYWWFRDDPAQHAGVDEYELAAIRRGREQSAAAGQAGSGLTAGALLGSGSMWLLMAQYFASNFTFFFCLSWLFPYLKQKYALAFVETGLYAMIPLLFGALGNWTAGVLVDALYRRGLRVSSRRWPAMAGFLLASAGMLGCLWAPNVLAAVVLLSAAIFGADMTLSPSWSACIDLGRRSSGAVSGTMNMAGNLGAFVTPLAFAYLAAWTGSTTSYFIVGAALNVLAVGAWALIRTDRPLPGVAG